MGIRNTDIVDEEIKLEDQKSHLSDGNTYSHPSFGMISVVRHSGNIRGLFGTETDHSSSMVITIENAEVTQSLGRNWYYGKTQIMEVELSPIQYSEMISNPNTSGVPCTIRHTSERGRIKSKHIDTVTQHVESVIDQKLLDSNKKLKSLISDVSAVLNKKGALKVSDKNEIRGLVESLVRDLTSSLPFYEESVKKSIAKSKSEAKMDIESYATHVISKLGQAVLDNPKAIKNLLEDHSGENNE